MRGSELHVPDLSDLIGRAYDEDSFTCWDCAVEVLRRFGVAWPSEPIRVMLDPHRYGALLGTRGPMRAGDVLWICYESEHVGVCLGATRFIHCTRENGVVIDRTETYIRSRRVKSAWRPVREAVES